MHKKDSILKIEKLRPKLSTFASLAFPNFRLFWLALFAANIGFQMQNVAINWHMYEITGSPLSLGLIGLITFLPLLVFSLPGGIIADTFPRKYIIMINQIVNFSTAIFLAFTTHLGLISPPLIYLAIAINAITLSFDLPARQATLPWLVPKEFFVNAVSLATLIRQTAIIVGPAIAGFLIEFFGVKSVYLVDIIVFLFAVGLLFFLPVVQNIQKSTISFSFSSIIEGVQFVRRRPIIYSTMLLDFFATFFSAATVLLPIFAKDILHIGPKGLGLLYAAPSVGAVVAGLILSSFAHVGTSGRLILIGILTYAISTIGFGLSRSFPFSLFFLAMLGAGDMVSTVIRNTIRQLLTPDYLRGRMVSINMLFFAGGPQLGEAEAGFLAAAIGASASVVVGGVATVILTTAVIFLFPNLWHYKNRQ